MDAPFYRLGTNWWHVLSQPVTLSTNPKCLITPPSPWRSGSLLTSRWPLQKQSWTPHGEDLCLLPFVPSFSGVLLRVQESGIEIIHQFVTMLKVCLQLPWVVLRSESLPAYKVLQIVVFFSVVNNIFYFSLSFSQWYFLLFTLLHHWSWWGQVLAVPFSSSNFVGACVILIHGSLGESP